MTDLIRVTTEQQITRIEINRPEKKNALLVSMYQAMADALRTADADPAVKAILIHGKPDCFSAGNDLEDFLGKPPHGEDAPVTRFLHAISTVAKPIIAAVGGPAVGIGTTMLLHCDLVYATPAAKFRLPFTSLGLVPEAASSLLLPAIAGYQRAAELLLLGQPFGADKAAAAGIVTAIVPEAELLDHATRAALAITALPASSVRMTKALMKSGQSAQVAERMAEESRLFRQQLASPEAKEAFTAFFEKRAPDFSRF